MVAQDEFRESVAQAQARHLQAQHLKDDYQNAVAAFTYFQHALKDTYLNQGKDTIPVGSGHASPPRYFQSGLPPYQL